MKTYFASPERADPHTLERQTRELGQNPFITELMRLVGGLVAVLNEQRQVLAVNDSFLHYLGLEHMDFMQGLRPGEVIRCVHAHEEEGGCGTTKYCSSCGAAIAIVACLKEGNEEPRKCVATVEREGKNLDICLRVQARSMSMGGERYVLLFLQDITKEEWRAFLERAFFHDINNIVGGLVQAGYLMEMKYDEKLRPIVSTVRHLVDRLDKEIKMQRALATATADAVKPEPQAVALGEVMQALTEAAGLISPSPAILFEPPRDVPALTLMTDRPLLLRVLTNMMKNAFEASDKGDTVKLRVAQEPGLVAFSVWNKKPIPDNVARRIFQCHFSTKPGAGRGIGTFSMKVFGEKVLGGKVNFTTSDAGTEFRFTVPMQQ